jgi:2,4'-dihydroxyacetophenone dioxygenase
MCGSLEFYDENDAILSTMDVFAFLDLYVCHCEANGIQVNERLIF